MKKRTKIFNSSLWKCTGTDELRPVLSCAYVEKGFIYVTDAYLAVRLNLSTFCELSDEEIRNLEGKFLHRNLLKHLESCDFVKFEQNQISCLYKGIKSKYEYTRDVGVFPNVNAVINELSPNPVDSIGINPYYLLNIYEAFNISFGGLIFRFNSKDKGIKVLKDQTDENTAVAILMPFKETERF
jgi:hypothetical protein